MAGSSGLRVHGLKEFRSACLKLQENKEFQSAMKRIAQLVVDEVKPQIPVYTGKGAATYKARAAGAGARVVFGSPKAPYVPWLEFGGTVGKGHKPNKPFTGSVKRERIRGGRWLYPTFWKNEDRIQTEVIREMQKLIQQFGLTVDPQPAPPVDYGKFMRDRGAK